MRTRCLVELENQFSRMTITYGYDNPHREAARMIYLRYRHNIMNTESHRKWHREMESMRCKDGCVMKRFKDAFHDTRELYMNTEVPYGVYSRVEYEWYAGTIYNGLRFKDRETALAYRNESLVKYPNCKVSFFKYIVGTF